MKGRDLLAVVVIVAGCTPSDARAPADSASRGARAQPDTTAAVAAERDAYLISDSGIGGIHLGMTLAEARRALPSATFARASDGEGIALVEVTLEPEQSLMLWAGEDDASAPIDWAKKVESIETFSPAFRTRQGVHPGIPVREVEPVYGSIRQIELSEIESRQYIAFANQPQYLTLRLDYTGIFRDGARATTEFEPGAKIMSIAISSR